MGEERKRILAMLGEGKISVEEADELLKALEGETSSPSADAAGTSSVKRLKHLKIQVDPVNGHGRGKKDRVNVKVPLALIRAGVKFHTILPDEAREKIETVLSEKGVGFRLEDLNQSNVESIIEALGDLSVDVDTEDHRVKIFCE